MKNIFTTFLILSFTLIKAQNVGINNANLSPDPSAGLDVNYTDKGVLIPRIALTGTNDVTTIPGAATSLLVYNTATVNDVTPGYYYWDGTQWLRLLNTGNAGGMEWLLTGNPGTTAGTNFLGTTDAQDLVFKTNNIENMRIRNTTGNVGIGTNAPTTTLQLNNNIYFDEGNGNVAVNPDIRFDQQGLMSADNNLYLNFDGANNSGTQALYIGYGTQNSSATNAVTFLDNGNTGIGTTTPTSKLQVIDRYDTTQTLTPFNTSSDRLPGISVYDNTDFIGMTTVDKDNNLSTTNDADGMIYWGDDNNAEDLRFTFMRWNNTRLIPTDHMIIKANGNVGIGTTTPNSPLYIARDGTSSSETNFLTLDALTAGAGRAMQINFKNTAIGYHSSIVGVDDGGFDGRIDFRTSDDGVQTNSPLGIADTRMSIVQNGYVGIGQYNPQGLLTLNAAAGQPLLRLENNGTTNPVVFYFNTTFSGYTNAAGILYIELAGSETYMFGGEIIPDNDGGWNIGAPAKRWNTIYATNGTINTSDARFKKNISQINYGIEEVMKLKPVKFQWNDPKYGEEFKIGFLAQDVEKIIPEVVRTGDDQNKTLGIFYSDIIPVLTKAIQEQQQIIDNNAKEIQLLVKQNEELKKQLEELKKLIIEKQ